MALVTAFAPATAADEPPTWSQCTLVDTDSCSLGLHTHPTSGDFEGVFDGTVTIRLIWGPADDPFEYTYLSCSGQMVITWVIPTTSCGGGEGTFPPINIPFEVVCETVGTGVGSCNFYWFGV